MDRSTKFDQWLRDEGYESEMRGCGSVYFTVQADDGYITIRFSDHAEAADGGCHMTDSGMERTGNSHLSVDPASGKTLRDAKKFVQARCPRFEFALTDGRVKLVEVANEK